MNKKTLSTNHENLKPKCIIYDPYLDTAGGGERYCLTVAECLLSKDWRVDIFWDNQNDVDRTRDRLNLRIEKARVIGVKPEQLSLVKKQQLLFKYNLSFWLSNGTVPVLTSKKNILHFQRPFINVSGKKLKNRFKLMLINHVVCNSKFTKKYIDQEFGISSKVLYPPVAVDEFKSSKKKENIILTVGRFAQSQGSKHQDILIKAFKQMVDEGLKNWKFILIGSSLPEPKQNKFLQKLKRMAKTYPIEFYVNAEFKLLKEFYAKSKIYWHAKGYRVEESREPWKTEHFGITPVEAMAAGCVPIVVNKGGLPEIVRRGVGEKWETINELKQKTKKIIKKPKKFKKYSQLAVKHSINFSKSKFCNNLVKLINKK